jgi:hypothetical protein
MIQNFFNVTLVTYLPSCFKRLNTVTTLHCATEELQSVERTVACLQTINNAS